MILVDANLLIYAVAPKLPQHKAAKLWLDEQLNGPGRVGLPWPSLIAFLRIVTNPRIFVPAVTTEMAWNQVRQWSALDQVWIPVPTDRHARILGEFLLVCKGQPKLVPDAHLAALAVEHNLTLCSADGDFARFSGLRWLNPLSQG